MRTGSASSTCCPARQDSLERLRVITACLWMLCSTATAQVFLGGTCPSALVISASCIRAFALEQKRRVATGV